MFTLIAHKPDSADYCRGCLMASYSGDLEIENNLTRDALVAKWADLLCKNGFLRCNEAGHDIYVLRDGVMVYQNGHVTWDGQARYGDKYGHDTGDYWEHFDEQEAEEAASNVEMTDIVAEVKAKAAALVEAGKTKIEAEAQRKANEDAERALAQRRQQFDALKKEFGDEAKRHVVRSLDGLGM